MDTATLEFLRQIPTADAELRRIIAFEREHGAEPYYRGFEYSDVTVNPHRLSQMILAGVIRKSEFASRAHPTYRVCDIDAAEATLSAVAEPLVNTSAEIPTDLFDDIILHDNVKEDLWRSIRGPKRVHCLLLGPPGTAKSLFLEALARLPWARHVIGATISKAGIVEYLLGQRCERLVIDEMDKADRRDTAVLLSAMDDKAYVGEMKSGRQSETSLTTFTVYAGANDGRKFAPEMWDRFWTCEVREYTDQEFVDVASAILWRREDWDPEDARALAKLAAGRVRSIRSLRNIARLSAGDLGIARKYVERFNQQ